MGRRVKFRPTCAFLDSQIGDRVTINSFCLISGAHVAAGAALGPFAHLRPGTTVGENAKVGNFVELKNTNFGPRSKVNHLSYLGDATIGADVNVGAGTITCNYDGVDKHRTVIERWSVHRQRLATHRAGDRW